jgi:hypothetical protein
MTRKALRNRRNSETARISSGVTNDSIMRKFDVPDPRPRQRCSDSAKATPSGTESIAVRLANFRLWTIACRRFGSCSTELFGSVTYQRSENPPHWVSERALLNEKSTAMATGTSDQATYPIARTHRNRVSPHGFAIARSRRLPAGRSAVGGAAGALIAQPGRQPGSCCAGSRGSG